MCCEQSRRSCSKFVDNRARDPAEHKQRPAW
jgi:hypothetical protein